MTIRLGFFVNCRTIVMATLLLFSSPQSLLEGAWQPPVQISDPTALPPGTLGGPVLAVTPQGNAIAVWPLSGTPEFPFSVAIVSAFYTRGVGWAPQQLVSSLALNPFGGALYGAQADPDIAMNSSNYAVATWQGSYNNDPFPLGSVFASVSSNGGPWGPVQIISDDLITGNNFAFNCNCTVSEAGTALAAWLYTDTTAALEYVTISFLPFGGSWTSPFNISNAQISVEDIDNFADPHLNLRGDAIVTWFERLPADAGGINASTYNSATATWTLAALETGGSFDHATTTISPRCGIDSNGNAIAVWVNFGTVKAAYFNGSAWESPVILYTGTADAQSPDVVMDSEGNSTAVWTDITLGQIYSSFRPVNGTWGPPVILDGSSVFFPFQAQKPLAVDLQGNVIAIWEDNASGNLVSDFRNFDPTWNSPEVITTAPSLYPNIGLASCGFAIACWQNTTASNAIMAAINENVGLGPNLPLNPQGKRCSDSFATQKRCCNILRWEPSSDICGGVIAYNIRRNGRLIATVKSSGSLKYTDCTGCCGKKYVYTLSSVNAFGVESEQVPFVFK